MASPDSPPAPANPPTDPEASRIKSLDDRFGALEREQAEQRGILGRIEQAITGGLGKAPSGAASDSNSQAPGGPSIREQVAAGVAEIQARQQREQQAAAAADADKQWRAGVDQQLAERRPTEPATGGKARLQRALIGKPDQ